MSKKKKQVRYNTKRKNKNRKQRSEYRIFDPNVIELRRVDNEFSLFHIPADFSSDDPAQHIERFAKVLHANGLTYAQFTNNYEFATFLKYANSKGLTVCVDYLAYAFVLEKGNICIMLTPDLYPINSAVIDFETFLKYVMPHFTNSVDQRFYKNNLLPFKNIDEIVNIIQGSSK